MGIIVDDIQKTEFEDHTEYRLDRALHRLDGPAVIYTNGRQEWWINGQQHRDNDLPAVINSKGIQSWWINGKRHRVGKPAVTDVDGYETWYENDVLHRESGPARSWPDGRRCYYFRGKKHRLDGPAIIYPNGHDQWWVNGKNITEEIEQWTEENNISMNWKTWSSIDKMYFALRFR